MAVGLRRTGLIAMAAGWLQAISWASGYWASGAQAQTAPQSGVPPTQQPAAPAVPGTGTAQAGHPEMSDIIDIRPPEAIWVAPDLWQVLLLVGLAIVVVFLAGAVIWWWRKKRAAGVQALPPQPPDVLALGRINELAGRADMSTKRYYFELSAILRQYIDGRFGVDALEMTAEELLPRLEEIGLAPSLEQDVRRFIKESDLIKFAKQAADREQMTRDTARIKGFVINTPVASDTEDPEMAEHDSVGTPASRESGAGKTITKPGWGNVSR